MPLFVFITLWWRTKRNNLNLFLEARQLFSTNDDDKKYFIKRTSDGSLRLINLNPKPHIEIKKI